MQKIDSKISSLTSIRFFAALLVAIHHTRTQWAHTNFIDLLGQIGWLGVSYFFVLSGFVLMWRFDPKLPKSVFVWKRLARIYPLHFVCLVTSLVCFAFFLGPLGGYQGTLPGTVANFFLLHDWLPLHPEVRQAWNGVSWTLSCEFAFYLAAPFAFGLLLKIRSAASVFFCVAGAWALVFGVAIFAICNHLDPILDFLFYHPLPQFLEFLLGASGAMLMRSGWTFKSVPISIAVMVIPVSIYCALVPENAGRQGEIMKLLFIPGAFLLIMSLVRRELNGATTVLRNKILVFLGDASYSFYMTHALLLGAFGIIARRWFPAISGTALWGEIATAIYLTAAIILSAVMYRIFERPTNRLLLSTIRQSPKIVPSSGIAIVGSPD